MCININLYDKYHRSVLGDCGGNYTGTNGTITSPNFPNPYPSAFCVYTITVPHGRACVEFRNFTIDDTYYLDLTSVYDGPSHLGVRLRRYFHVNLSAKHDLFKCDFNYSLYILYIK